MGQMKGRTTRTTRRRRQHRKHKIQFAKTLFARVIRQRVQVDCTACVSFSYYIVCLNIFQTHSKLGSGTILCVAALLCIKLCQLILPIDTFPLLLAVKLFLIDSTLRVGSGYAKHTLQEYTNTHLHNSQSIPTGNTQLSSMIQFVLSSSLKTTHGHWPLRH